MILSHVPATVHSANAALIAASLTFPSAAQFISKPIKQKEGK